MNGECEILRHHAVRIDHLHARALQRARERLELLVPVQIRAVQQSARPREDRRDRVRRRLAALLVFAVVPRDGPVRRFALHRLAVRRDELRSHHAERAEALRENVRLHVSVVILCRPDEAAGGLDGLRDHVVDETVLVVDSRCLELLLVFPVIHNVIVPPARYENVTEPLVDLLEDVLKSPVVLLQDGILGG